MFSPEVAVIRALPALFAVSTEPFSDAMLGDDERKSYLPLLVTISSRSYDSPTSRVICARVNSTYPNKLRIRLQPDKKKHEHSIITAAVTQSIFAAIRLPLLFNIFFMALV